MYVCVRVCVCVCVCVCLCVCVCVYLPDTQMAAPENVLFVVKLNPVTR